jgi:hypothetical protein
MKASQLTKNRRGQRGAPRVSLFPFLAVLICTMGALVLILFAVMRQARIQAAREATAKLVKQHDDCKAEREAVQWRVQQLEQSHKKSQAQLADLRLNLGHIEDHSRRLRQQITQLQATAKKLDQSQNEVQRKQNATREQLQAVETQVSDAERRLDAARKAAQNKPRSYAIIPYEGPNETHRRPIYIECRADAVIIQPEGVTLRPSDFDGPLGPGNPLAAALRAVREHLVTIGAFNPERDGEPYPLMLVRPSGIIAYYAARAGMQSWGSDFGYELIGESWPLQFPPPDPRLGEAAIQAVATARLRQQEIAAAAPVGYRENRSRAVYRAGPAGGLIREGGSSADDDDGYDTPRAKAQRPGPRYGNAAEGSGSGASNGSASRLGGGAGSGGSVGSSTGTGFGGTASGGFGTGAGNGVGPGTGGGFGPPTNSGIATGAGNEASATSGNGTVGGSTGFSGGAAPVGAGSGPNGGTASGTLAETAGAVSNGGPILTGAPGATSSMPAGAVATGGTPGTAGGTPGGTASAGGTISGTSNNLPTGGVASGVSGGSNGTGSPSQKPPEGYIPGRPYEAPATPPPRPQSQTVAGDALPTMPLRPGEWYPSEPRPPRRPEEPEKDRWDKDRDPHKKIEMSPAEKRGRDWALRNAGRGAVPVTRPIRVECYPDRLVIVPEQGTPVAAPIPFDGRTSQSLDRLISVLWDHMEGWGIAGKGMYWRPVLKIRVAPGAEQRFNELSYLLEGSGMTVQREP